jgi:hypothetical protein
MSIVKIPSNRNVLGFNDNLFIPEEAKKRQLKLGKFAPPRYVNWYDHGRMNIMKCIENIGWKSEYRNVGIISI